MEIEAAKRRFMYKDEDLGDPGADIPADKVLEIFSVNYPELTNASVGGPEVMDDGTVVYKIDHRIATKG